MNAITYSQEGDAMFSGFEAWFAKWGWVAIGLSCGFAAKYALRIKRGLKVKPWQVFADVLLVPFVGLIAYALTTRLGAEGEIRALLSGFCMVGADRLVSILTDWFLLKVQAATLRDVRDEVIEASGDLRQTVAKVDAARSLAAQQRGEAPPEGDDHAGKLAHRFPPLGGGA
jgi:hypothetical protein